MPDTCTRTDLVVKDNALIEASYRLSLNEHRLVLAAIVEGREADTLLSTRWCEITVDHFVRLFPDANHAQVYDHVREACDSLMRRQFSFSNIDDRTGKPCTDKFQWVEQARYIPGAATVRIRFTEGMIPYITRLEQKYTEYRLELIAPLTSQYAVRMYELMLQYLNTSAQVRDFSLANLRHTMGVGPKEYSSIKDFKARVIDPAVKQINQYTDIRVNYENIKTGRTVTGLLFTIEEAPKKSVKGAKRPKDEPLTNENIERLGLARAGETYEQARSRLRKKRGGLY